MIPFDLAEPDSLNGAIALLDPEDPTIRPMGGGTALMLMMKAGVFNPEKLVSLRKIEPSFFEIAEADGGIRLGALATLSSLEHSPLVQKHLPLVVTIMKHLANVRVRNVATVGGALAHADPHMDLPPTLMALGAVATLIGPNGERTLPLEEMLTGYYETALKKDELIAHVHVPSQGSARAVYRKVTTGSADDWPAVGIAIRLEVDGPTVTAARVVVSAATEKAMRLETVEAGLAGKTVDDALLHRLGDLAAESCEPIADVRGSAPYKRELIRVTLRRAIREALDGPKEAH